MLARNCPKGKEPILTMAMQMAGGGDLSNGHCLWEKWDFCSEFEKHFSSGNNSSLLNLVFLLTLALFNVPQCTTGLNFKKFSHLRISGSFDRGRELKKK